MSLDGNWGGEIDAAVTAKLATASGHIVLLVLARPAAWTGGRPESGGSSSGTRHFSWRTSPAAAVARALSTQTLSAAREQGDAVQRRRCDWRLSTRCCLRYPL